MCAGEWVGHSASFASNGQPLTLPETYVPREYADWDIQISDWATVSSLNAKGDDSPAVLLLTKFMLPTVGCEADAASFVEDKRLYSSKAQHVADDVQAFSHSGPTGSLAMSSTHQHFIGYPERLPESGKAVLDVSVALQSQTRYDMLVECNVVTGSTYGCAVLGVAGGLANYL